MNHVIETIGPIFGLIAIGYLASRLQLLSREAGKGLSEFVFTIAMPAFLFKTMVTVALPAGSSLGLIAAFLGSVGVIWLLASLATLWPLRRPFADSASIAMTASFGNVVMMGVPLTIGHYGEAAAGPLAVLIALHAPVLWFVATLQSEMTTRQGGASMTGVLAGLFRDLLRNPILIGIVGGALWRLTEIGLGVVPDKIISLLGQAGIPGALFALGLSLANFEIKGQVPTIIVANCLKLIFLPFAAYVIAAHILQLPQLWTGVVVLLAACPTGANAFLFASRYQRGVGTASASVALGTVISVLTISVLLLLLDKPN